MIKVQRPIPAPAEVVAALTHPRRCGRTELEAARHYYSTIPRQRASFEFERYGEYAVCVALDKAFSGKCAYCEASYHAVSARNIDHYRPKAAVAEDRSHPGYWWLAAHWENLLPACLACNQRRRQVQFRRGMTLNELELELQVQPTQTSGKGESFPTSSNHWIKDEGGEVSTEDPLLIDPCVSDPSVHLEWVFDYDTTARIWEADPIFPFVCARRTNRGVLDEYGSTSIAVYGLNRAGLMKDRMEKLREMQVASHPIVDLVDDLSGIDDHASPAATKLTARLVKYRSGLLAFTHPGRPFSGMASAYVEAFKAQVFA